MARTLSSVAKRLVRQLFHSFGYSLVPVTEAPPAREFPADFDFETQELCRFVRPFTMTSPERIAALRQSVQYLVRNEIPGDILECGVWKGGSMMAAALTLMECGETHRRLHLYDTFEGMSEPTVEDVNFRGVPAAHLLAQSQKARDWVWAYSTLEEVKRNLATTGYPTEHISFVVGKVENTIPAHFPEHIALLRLDTDWYESTRHELNYLYPRLSVGGVLIIDDYGHWAGARKAVDEYIARNRLRLLLNRLDYSGRLCVKLE